ncbi:recombinase family protein [Kitasatospora sp. NPDC051914]|uniref:recombinase family protein n=1 Tax=Kitasatospora sp. NPDC051914 TaxID=3154945 RepID=UPI00341C7F1E
MTVTSTPQTTLPVQRLSVAEEVVLGVDTPDADIRIGYAKCSHLTQELQSQLDALSAHGIPRDKIFSEKISTRVRVRPQFEAALALAREIKAHAPHCRVLFTVYEMKRLGRDAAELTAPADHLTAHGLVLEMLAGPLPGIYDPSGPGRILFGFFAAMAKTERESIREATLEGLDAAAPQGQARRSAAGHHRRHAAHSAATPGSGRVRRADPPRPDHPHRQAQEPEPGPGRHLPGARRARESARRTPKPSPRPTPTSQPSRSADSESGLQDHLKVGFAGTLAGPPDARGGMETEGTSVGTRRFVAVLRGGGPVGSW